MNDLPKDTAEGRQMDLEVGTSSSSASQNIPVAPGQDTVEISVVVHEVTSSIDDIQNRLLMMETLNKNFTRVTDVKVMNAMKKFMDQDLDGIRTTAREVSGKLEALERSNAANRKIMNSQAGSSTDRARIDQTSDLKKRLRELGIAIEGLRKTFQDGYRRAVELRLSVEISSKNVHLLNEILGQSEVITRLMKTGDSQQIFQNAIVARGRVALKAIAEIQKRRAAFQDFEEKFLELHQIFLDMGIFVEPQGEPVEHIEPEVDPEFNPDVDLESYSEVDPQVDLDVDHSSNCVCITLIFCILVFLFSVVALVVKLGNLWFLRNLD